LGVGGGGQREQRGRDEAEHADCSHGGEPIRAASACVTDS
jgi:hypothetical protein